MSKMRTLAAMIVAAAFLAQSTLAIAATSARIIPTGTVTTIMDGKQADQFQSETIMPQGTLMLCDGTCLVQMHNLQVVAKDKAVFALAETPERWNMTIKSGQVDFAMGPQAKLIDFSTPHDTIRTQEIVLPASTESRVVKGSIIVTEGGTELVLHQGTLRISTRNGSQLIQPGRSITLAQGVQAIKPTGGAVSNSAKKVGAGGVTAAKVLPFVAVGATGAVLAITQQASGNPSSISSH